MVFSIFEQVSVGFEPFEIFLATVKSMLHLNMLTIGIDNPDASTNAFAEILH